MNRGWYRSGRDILDELESGRISLLDFAVLHFLELAADHETGVTMASAEKIAALTHGVSYKAIQRSLARLEKIGRIKRWLVRGGRGNYPVLICPYFVHEVSIGWKVTSAERTTDWRDVQFDPVHEVSAVPDSSVRSSVHEVSAEVSGIQEGEGKTKNREKGGTEFGTRANGLHPAWIVIGCDRPVGQSRRFQEAWENFYLANLGSPMATLLDDGLIAAGLVEDFIQSRQRESKKVPKQFLAVKQALEKRRRDARLADEAERGLE